MVRKLIVALSALLLAVGACAGESEEHLLTGDAALAALRSAPDAASAAGSARFEMTISLESPDGAFDIEASGAYQGTQMEMTMDWGAALAGLAAAEGQALPSGFDEPMQIVVDGATTYLRIPMLAALTGADGWLAATAEELSATGGSFGLSGGAADPSKLLDLLRGVADDVEERGTEPVRGVPTTRVAATVDVARALEQAPAEQREALGSQLEGLDVGTGSIPIEVWVDADGLVRRVVMDFGDLALGALGADGTASMTLELFDYGAELDITVPDPSETTPLSGALGAFAGLG